MATNANNTIQSHYGLTTRTTTKKTVRRGPRTELNLGPDTPASPADQLTGPGSEARRLMEYHRNKAQELISNAISRGTDKSDAIRFARGHLLAGQKARIQYQAEIGLA